MLLEYIKTCYSCHDNDVLCVFDEVSWALNSISWTSEGVPSSGESVLGPDEAEGDARLAVYGVAGDANFPRGRQRTWEPNSERDTGRSRLCQRT